MHSHTPASAHKKITQTPIRKHILHTEAHTPKHTQRSTNTHMHTHAQTRPYAHTPFVIRTSQRVVASEAGHVDVVFDDHHVSHLVVLVQTAGCIGQDDRLHAQELEDPHGQCDLKRGRGVCRIASFTCM